MLKYVLWYLVVGFALVSVYGIGAYIGLIAKYGLDIAIRGIKRCNELDVAHGENLYEEIANTIIGIIVWPARLSDAPELTAMMHQRCKELLNESKNSAS